MGGHIDDNDHHGCLFDREALTELMVNAGLERIGEWKSEIQDAASLPISLNLQGFKPIGNQQMPEGVFGVLSAPRFGPVMHMQCAFDALAPLQIQYVTGQGAFWSQVLSDCMEKLLDNVRCRYILTIDYDSVFSRHDVLELYRLMEAYPDCGALCPVQSMRGTEMALFGITDKTGKPKTFMYSADFAKHVTPIFTGHFGLTMIRADCLRQLPKPWMCPKPTPSGQWIEGKVDADISFWHNWKKAGFVVGLANRIIVGHLEEVVKWPGDKFQPIYQETKDYNVTGIPAEVRR